VAVLLVASVVMAWMLVTETETPEVDPGPTHPERGAVDQMLVFAEQEARDGDPDAAVQALELARSRARRDRDVDGLRRVLREQGLMKDAHASLLNHAHASFDLAADIYTELNDQESVDRVLTILGLENR
jgi:hypothetical protein